MQMPGSKRMPLHVLARDRQQKPAAFEVPIPHVKQKSLSVISIMGMRELHERDAVQADPLEVKRSLESSTFTGGSLRPEECGE